MNTKMKNIKNQTKKSTHKEHKKKLHSHKKRFYLALSRKKFNRYSKIILKINQMRQQQQQQIMKNKKNYLFVKNEN